ncbi:hypothetical protein B0H19DRAFT_1173544 [Mycena capillaripes]|nr:hypothetical protein B0H19DRAFT_1173544 [Mycena capillaripes]
MRSSPARSPLSNVLALEDVNGHQRGAFTADFGSVHYPNGTYASLHSNSPPADTDAQGEEDADADAPGEDEEQDADGGDGSDSEYVDNGSESDGDGEFLPPGVRRRARSAGGRQHAPYAYSSESGGSGGYYEGGGYGYEGGLAVPSHASSYGSASSSPYGSSASSSAFHDPVSTFHLSSMRHNGRNGHGRKKTECKTERGAPRARPCAESHEEEPWEAGADCGDFVWWWGVCRRPSSAKAAARLYTCKVPGCGKCFARGEHLKRHVRSIHTYEKPHKCPYPGCGKGLFAA